MGRSKVKYSYILNHTLRRNTLRKRRLCVAKKLYELTTLCDVEACTVIYSEIDSEPFVWPSIDEVRRLITKYHTFSKAERGKRKVNQETFTRQRLGKTEEMLRRQQRENRRNQMTYIMYQSMINPQTAMSRLNVEDFVELDRVTGQNLEEVTRMMATFNPPPPPPQFGADGSGVVGGSQDEFMPPNYGGFDSLVAPNYMPYHHAPPPPFMEFAPPNYMGFQPPVMDFPQANMGFPYDMHFMDPPNMGFQPQNAGLPYMDPNMGIPDQTDLPPFP
ncbi:agamous-like MADS-box protein AGL80 [Impatiens glandulifera]|uniref:agamous-like MADS-box protein AGL80 n=1 Tax=Impatiens glandulifera TaxID=253017 RepID=UPI001FB0608D|nr:agamous-like MADS-box protein AGL80 [Impatiens glandulifera]